MSAIIADSLYFLYHPSKDGILLYIREKVTKIINKSVQMTDVIMGTYSNLFVQLIVGVMLVVFSIMNVMKKANMTNSSSCIQYSNIKRIVVEVLGRQLERRRTQGCCLYSVLCTLYSVTRQPPDTHNPLTANMECIRVLLVTTRTVYENYPIYRNREMSEESRNGCGIEK